MDQNKGNIHDENRRAAGETTLGVAVMVAATVAMLTLPAFLMIFAARPSGPTAICCIPGAAVWAVALWPERRRRGRRE